MKRIHVVTLAVGLALSAIAFSATAQRGNAVVSPARNVGDYAGVRPGSANQPPRMSRVQARRENARLLTWPGFEMRDNGSRFFLQLSTLIPTETTTSEGQFEVLLRGVTTHVRNTRRPLITRFFNTPVLSARVERRGRSDLAMVFKMRTPSTPRISNAPGQDGFYFIYIDFPSGNYLPSNNAPPLPVADDRPLLTNQP
ncbi:MAG: hypothetical protein AAGE52_15235 [Myxococcota bacterium]